MKVDILYVFDDNYAEKAAVSLTSLLHNNKHLELISVHIIAESISEYNKNEIFKIVENYNCKIKFYDSHKIVKLLNENNVHKPSSDYARFFKLFFELVVSIESEKLLYIDGDCIIVNKLDDLLSIEMKEYPVAMVKDSFFWHGFPHNNRGIPEETILFNSGVILYNLTVWRDRKITQRLLEQIKELTETPGIRGDQDWFNLFFYGQIRCLLPQYNLSPLHFVFDARHFLKEFPIKDYYSVDELDAGKENRTILHAFRFLGERVWDGGKYHPFSKEWEKYSCLAGIRVMKKNTKKINWRLRIEQLLFYCIPRNIFLKIWSKESKKISVS